MPEMTDPTSEIERISERIKALVADHFARGEERFYLSGLGSVLADDRAILEKLSKRKLADFVENVLGFEIGRSGQHNNILHIVRPEALGPPTVRSDRKPVKFAPEIWSAFTTALAPGERRYFDPTTRQVSSEPDPEGSAREIPENLISDGAMPAGQSADRIRQWLEEQGLDLSLVVSGRTRREVGPSLLHQVLEALDGEQLRRTTLPLDVIKTLSERRGS